MTDFSPQNMNEALAAHLKAVKENNQEVITKTHSFFDAQEKKNQDLVAQIGRLEVAKAEFEEKATSMEKMLSRPDFSSKSEEGKVEMKAFENFMRLDIKGMSDVEKKYMRTDSGPDGGFLVPDAFSTEIAKKITEISDVRAVARVMKVGAKTTILPLRSNLVSVGWVGEGDQDSLSNSQYGQPLLTLKKIQVTVPVTHEELIDSGVSIVDQISSDVAEAFAQKEGEGYVNGTASPTQPQGFMNPGAITQETNSGNATQLTWQSMSEVTGKIKTGYRPIYGFNRFTRANLLQMVDGVGRPLWQAGNIAAGIPNTINGYSYIELPNMARS